MAEKHSKFIRATGFRVLLTVSVIFGCGLSHIYAGNRPSKPEDPWEEMAAIQYNTVKGVRQLRKDFIDNQKFADLLLKASDEYVKFVTDSKDWRPAVKAYHAAFEELKTRLQGKWREIFGDGPSRFPWNGCSDGATDLWREDDLRRDMPVVLSLWDHPLLEWGHICRTEVTYICGYTGSGFHHGFLIPNDNDAYVPKNSSAYPNQTAINKGKGKYKAYVLQFFNASSLSKCKRYLEKFFCAPVTELLVQGSACLQEAGAKDCREDLQLLLTLYADYYSLDSVVVHNREYYCLDDPVVLVPPIVSCRDNPVRAMKCMVQLMVSCYSNYGQWNLEDQKWLCSLLDNLDANYYVKENLHTYCIQSHDLLRGCFHLSKRLFYGYYGAYCKERLTQCEGLIDVFKKLENPLPETTWQKFVYYAGRRWSLVREASGWRECVRETTWIHRGQNNANTVLHRSKTFEQVPCASLEEMEVKKEERSVSEEWKNCHW